MTYHGKRWCWLCRLFPEQQDRCIRLSCGVIDRHHLIPQAVLKRECKHHERGIRAILDDTRNLKPLRRLHHEQWHARIVTVERVQLGVEVECFAEELGLSWYLDRTFGGMSRPLAFGDDRHTPETPVNASCEDEAA